MKHPKHHLPYILLIPALIILTWLIMIILLSLFTIATIDLSQDYRNIQGVENITFERNGWGHIYQRCFWGLKKTGEIPAGSPKSDDSKDELLKLIDADIITIDNWIRQSIYSPDKKYILYCEVKYGDSGASDDEYCYYRVYEIETGKITTLYQAYREWYNLSWPD